MVKHMKKLLVTTFLFLSPFCLVASDLDSNDFSYFQDSYNMSSVSDRKTQVLPRTGNKIVSGVLGALVGGAIGFMLYPTISGDRYCNSDIEDENCGIAAMVTGAPIGAIVGASTGVYIARNKDAILITKSFRF